jgi:hypothetical protein
MNDQRASISLWVRVLFVSAVTAFAFLVVEGMTRAFLSGVEPLVPPEVGRCDSQLGWALRAGEVSVSHRTGLPVEYRINSKGLRDNETTYDKPEGVFRIVVIGDSNAFGVGVPIEKHFTQLLEGYFRDLEVINLGVGGFGIDQELLFLRTEGFRYRPDLVIAYMPHTMPPTDTCTLGAWARLSLGLSLSQRGWYWSRWTNRARQKLVQFERSIIGSRDTHGGWDTGRFRPARISPRW